MIELIIYILYEVYYTRIYFIIYNIGRKRQRKGTGKWCKWYREGGKDGQREWGGKGNRKRKGSWEWQKW